MLPIKYSFKLLSNKEAKKIRLDFIYKKYQKKHIVIKEAKENFEKEDIVSDDSKKRRFLKLAGIVGLGAVASLFFPKKAEALVFGSTPASNVVGLKDDANARVNPATEDTLDTLLKPDDLDFDGSGYLNVNVKATSPSSFSDSLDVSKLALVDGNRNVQVDIVDSSDLQKINFGGVKFALRMATVGNFDYVGEAPIGSATSSNAWRIKRIDNTSGIVITWAGIDPTYGDFDQVWDNYPSLTYS